MYGMDFLSDKAPGVVVCRLGDGDMSGYSCWWRGGYYKGYSLSVI